MSEPPHWGDLLSSPEILRGMRTAYEESNVGGDHPIEQGGFILRDLSTSALELARLPHGSHDSLQYPVCPGGLYNGKRIVGSFHTHPNLGSDWSQEPSPQDIRLSTDFPETMGPNQFVISRDAVYHIDNEGVVSELGPTRQLLQFDREV